MLLQTLFLFLVGLLSVSAKLHTFSPRSEDASKASHVYAKLQARVVPSATLTTRGVSRTVRYVKPANLNRQHRKRDTWSAARIYGILRQCLDKVHTEVANINAHCNTSQSPEEIIPALQEDLRKILDAVNTALYHIKNCDSGPLPSGSPDTPPSLPDICRLIIELVSCLASIIPAVAKVLRSPAFHHSCGDIIAQITSCVSQIISAIDSRLPGTISSLSQLGQDLWKSIQFHGFGFSAITNLVKPL